MSKRGFNWVLVVVLLYACGNSNKPSHTGVVQAKDTATLADTGWSIKESKQIKDSLLDKWMEKDGLDFTLQEYEEIWAELTRKEFNPGKMIGYLNARKQKFVSADIYFVLTQVSAYFYLTEAHKNKRFNVDEKMQVAVRNVEQNMQKWYAEKIVWECVDDGQPLKDHYVLLQGGKARTYFSYLLCTMNQGSWRKQDSITWIKFGTNETKYIENDTMFLNQGKGRSLYKIPVSY
ncbi:MAG TPA: hypothetical protein VK177_11900 [Flavobacteriales bacterium]|nr:hypothetical protein [Flavobacteriales bacterium]